jgi:hypothetical protein
MKKKSNSIISNLLFILLMIIRLIIILSIFRSPSGLGVNNHIESS